MKSTIDQAFDHLIAARGSNADVTIAVSPGGAVVILVTPRAREGGASEMLSLEEARALGKFKTTRTIRDAGRAGELALYGTQRTRRVKRGEFEAWLVSRRQKPIQGFDDADMDRRIARLAAAREAKKGKR